MTRQRTRQIRARMAAAQRRSLAAHAAERGLPAETLATQRLRAAAGLASLAPAPELDAAQAAAADLNDGVTLRASEAELDAYRAAAEVAGLSLSAWIRTVLAA